MTIATNIQILLAFLLVLIGFMQGVFWFLVNTQSRRIRAVELSLEHLHRCVHDHVEEFIADHAPFAVQFQGVSEGQASLRHEMDKLGALFVSISEKMHAENQSAIKNISQKVDALVTDELRRLHEENRILRNRKDG